MKKILTLIISILMIIAPVTSLADTGHPIVGPATTTVEKMEDWARSKGAHPEFINQAQTFYDVSVAYGIDPAVTYAQSAKETNYFKFTGVLTIDFKNPCGLKTTEGGGNYDPNAHKVFSSWEEGITAQVHHLALYAGHPDFPMEGSPDPRHFSWIGGTAPTVEDLGGKWAPSETYGTEIVKMMDQFAIESTQGQEDIVEENPKEEIYTDREDIQENYGGVDQEVNTSELANESVEAISEEEIEPIKRIFGKNRGETSLEIAKQIAKPGTKRVILTSGDEFSNALLASSLTKLDDENAPIILVGRALDQKVLDEVSRIDPEEIIIVGSYSQVTSKYDNTLEYNGYNTYRISGRDRYVTANRIAEYTNSNKYILVNGDVFADALCISAYAAENQMPILLTNGTDLDTETANKLINSDEVLIIGGENSVSLEIERDLHRYTKVSRISGSNRFETGVNIAEKLYPVADSFVIVDGWNFPDALAGAPIAGEYDGPILLTDSINLSGELANYLNNTEVNNIIVLGGTNSVSQEVYRDLTNYID